MYASRKHILKIDLVAVLFVLVSGFATAEDVILYDKAPSVDELQRQLTGGGGKKNKERAIVFGDSEPAPQETAPAMQPASPQANFRPELNQQAQSLQADTKQQATRESKKAIAFPINFRVNSAEILPAAIPFLEAINGLMQKTRAYV